MINSLLFRAAYDVSTSSEDFFDNSALRTWYFPGGSEIGGRDGLALVIRPHSGEAFRAVFESGEMDSGAITRVLSCPDPEWICVVASGTGYMLQVQSAKAHYQLPCLPIMFAEAYPKQQVLLFADYQDIVAVDRAGMRWRAERVASDGIKLDGIKDGQVVGHAWSAPQASTVPFAIDLVTGERHGGAE